MLPELIDSFLRNECVAHQVDDDSFFVVHVHAYDAAEAWREIMFFLRAWQSRHPDVSAVVSS